MLRFVPRSPKLAVDRVAIEEDGWSVVGREWVLWRMVLFGEPTRKDGGRARRAREWAGRAWPGGCQRHGRGLARDGVHDSDQRRGCKSWGVAVRTGEEFTGESPLSMAMTIVTAMRGDGPSRRSDRQARPPNSKGPINGLGLVRANSVEVLGWFGGF